MVKSISLNTPIWQNPVKQDRMYDSFVSFWKDHTTVNIQKETVFSKDALYSGGMAIGSGFMNASVDWSPNSTEDEPVMLIIGIPNKNTEIVLTTS